MWLLTRPMSLGPWDLFFDDQFMTKSFCNNYLVHYSEIEQNEAMDGTKLIFKNFLKTQKISIS